MKQLKVEFVVGIFFLVGLASLTFMAVKMGNFSLFSQDTHYEVIGRFGSISGLKDGAHIEIAGVKVGTVDNIDLDPLTYEALVTMKILEGVEIPFDSSASIRTSGIIGDKYIKITMGVEDDLLEEGAEFEFTESTLDIEELISKFVFSSDKENSGGN